MYVVVIGGGTVGFYLTRELLAAGIRIGLGRSRTSWAASWSPTTAARAATRLRRGWAAPMWWRL